MATPAQELVAIVGAMLGELRGGAPPAVALDAELERDLGIDSLARVELSLRIEQAFGVRLAEDRVLAARSVRDLLAALAGAAPRVAQSLAVEAPLAEGLALAPAQATTLVEVLDWHAARHPDRAHVLLLEGEAGARRLSCAELAQQARELAGGLAREGLEPGAAAAIMLPNGFEFLRAFFGVLLAGGVPVPLYPPSHASELEEHLRRQARILDNCAATLLVGAPALAPAARLLHAQVPALRRVVSVDALAARGAPAGPAARTDDTALLQYTSGSTGQPKGVVLTHANLLANIRAMGEAVQARAQDTFVSWLPLTHDMGLIGAWLGSLYYGMPLVLLTTQDFLARPSRWLHAVHRYRGTLTAGPNSAYEILASKVPENELRGLELSSLRIAFSGAEPVRAATLERFARRFAPYGFESRAATPAYGLAECAVGLTISPPGRGPLVDARGPSGAQRVVSSGRPLAGHEVRVVAAAGREAAERVEGRIEFRGPSATSGYFRNPAATRALLRAGWLDTGDVGYIAAGELYVTGRMKELIIRGGQHIHPYDLEEAVGDLAGVRKGAVAVFGAADPASATERVVVLVETDLRDAGAREELRRRVAGLALRHLGVPADDIVLAGRRAVLKTPGGKIRRSACSELYERGLLGAPGRPVALQLGRLALAGLGGLARRLARSVAEWLYAAYLWALFAVFAVAGGGVLCALPGAQARARWVRAVAGALQQLSLLEVQVSGRPPAAPAIFVANHSSYVDALLLAALLPAGARFTAKRELASAPFAGWILARFGTRFVERFAAREAIEGARELSEAARTGESLVIFPEGTFTRAPGLRAFHMGAFVAAAQSGRPVVPVALRGTRSVLRDGSWLPRRSPVEAFIGAPLEPRGAGWTDALVLRDEARRAILAHCGEPDRAGG